MNKGGIVHLTPVEIGLDVNLERRDNVDPVARPVFLRHYVPDYHRGNRENQRMECVRNLLM